MDPWEEEGEGETSPRPSHRIDQITRLKPAQQRSHLKSATIHHSRTFLQSEELQKSCPPVNVPSLIACCLKTLADHLEELIELGEDVLPHLPPDCKEKLIAVALQLGLLTDQLLTMLADEGQSTLSLHTLRRRLVTEKGLIDAASRMPNLKYLDLTGFPVHGKTIRMLPQWCPGIQVLRIGGCVTMSTLSMGEAILQTMPALEKDQHAVLEAWDDLPPDQHLSPLSKTRFMDLKCVVWPEMPHSIRDMCRQKAPAALINPSEGGGVLPGYPLQCKPSYQLDLHLLQGVAGGWQRPDSATEIKGQGPVELHIAEKFRLAYITRAQRINAKLKRNAVQEQRRALKSSSAEQAIRRWEHEL